MNNDSKKFIPFGKVSDISSETGMVGKTVEGKPVVVFKKGNSFCALSNICPHAGGRLSEGTFDGEVVQCPLHGTQFNVETGEVVAPPATRPAEKIPVRVSGDSIEVEVSAGGAAPRLVPTPLPPKSVLYWWQLGGFALGAILFWVLQFLYQYYFLVGEELSLALIRSFALTGTTLIGCALFSSAIFKWFPRTAQHWRFRRYFGVSGFGFISLHVLTVLYYIYGFSYSAVYFSYNPIRNPIVFGSLAFFILFMMASTSTDWAVVKLTPRVWKFIHRFVYIAYVSAIFHFILMDPFLIKNFAGAFLVLITLLALFGQLFWFYRIASRRQFRSLGSVVGILIILGTLLVGYLVFSQ